jgi:hypothetical protein
VLAHPSCTVGRQAEGEEFRDADHVAVDDLRVAVFDQLVAMNGPISLSSAFNAAGAARPGSVANSLSRRLTPTE